MIKEKLPADFSLKARRIVELVTEEKPAPKLTPQKEESAKNPHAVALGRLGASKGGKARAAKLTKEQRIKSARKAAKARWSKK